MQKISLHPDRFHKLNTGTKSSTIRRGRRMFEKGLLLLYADNDETKTHIVHIKEIRYKKWQEMDDGDALANGYKDADSLRHSLLEFYPDVGQDDEMTIIVFKTA